MYPFPDIQRKEITDPQTIYQALSSMDDGFFPLGVNGFPHGGVHFGNGSASRLDQSGGVRCIADGEIVAYKIDNRYPHLQFADGKWAAYSTGFVLVRHRLTLPSAPNSTGIPPTDETLNPYSLYLHMADWSTYLADGKLPRPYWWDVEAFRISDKDRQLAPDGGPDGAVGAFVWTEPTAVKSKGKYAAGKRVGFLPEGSEVIIGEARGKWLHIKAITAGTMISPTSGGVFGSDDLNVPWKAPEGSRNVPTAAEGDWGWLYRPNLQAAQEPKVADKVVIPAMPIRVKAGTLLGQIGEYQDYERATPLPPISRRRLLHLEVFASDAFSGFLDRSRARAAQLPADQRSLLVIGAGAKLVQTVPAPDRKLRYSYPVKGANPMPDSPASGPWVKVRPTYLAQGFALLYDGPPVWIEREHLGKLIDSTPAWSQFPLRLQGMSDPANGLPLIYSRGQLDALDAKSKATDEQQVNWWRVPFGTADGKSATGWVCEKNHPGTKWESPWAWPGFEIVDATGIQLPDAFRRNLVITGAANWKEQKEFEPSAAAVNNSALLLKLQQTIAKLESAKGADKVTARAIQSAMRVRPLAQALSHVILRYESEWGGDMSRWNSITPLMRNARDNWVRELERIKKLQWWNELKGKVVGFPANPTVHHIHPIALIANFLRRHRIDIEKFVSLYKGAHSSSFGWYDSASSPKQNLPPLSEKSEQNLKTLMHWIDDLYISKNEKFSIQYVAYMLATARVESYDFTTRTFFGPFSEIISYDDAERRYGCGPTGNAPSRAKAHGNTVVGDGYKYRGRGLVQITWKINYQKFTALTGIDLTENPDKALPWENSAFIMIEGMLKGIFTGHKLSNYIDESGADYVGARMIINGTDKNKIIAEYASKFELILRQCI
ncbi:lytic transglycosylase domain-containing protein [Cupriavidus necator]